VAKARLKPVTEIKRRASEIIDELRKDPTPILITMHGRSAAVLLDVDAYDEINRRMAILEGIVRGERAIAEGRVVTQRQAKQRLRKWRVEQK
jgi:prevent-host-death family protein